MYKLPHAAVINSRYYASGTQFFILDSRVVKGGFMRVTILIGGVKQKFNIAKGHWMYDYLNRGDLGMIADNSTIIEHERSAGEARKRHIEALEEAITLALKGERIQTYNLFDWHRHIFADRQFAGMVRTVPAHASISLHRYCEPEVIRPRFYKFIDNFPFEESDWTYLAEAHYEFMDTHVFIDGNGRLGRVMLNWHSIYTGHGLICIHADDRPEYISLLENKDMEGLAALFERSELR